MKNSTKIKFKARKATRKVKQFIQSKTLPIFDTTLTEREIEEIGFFKEFLHHEEIGPDLTYLNI